MSGYIGNIPIPQATQTRDVFTATANQTSFATSGYTPGFLDVYLNGVKLIDGTDFTASNGSDVVLNTGAALDDTLEILSYSTFEVNSQNFTGNTVIDNVDINGGTIDGTVIGGSSPAAVTGTVGSFSSLSVNSNPLPTAGPLSNRNKIINGAMQIAQRGTNFAGGTTNADDAYTLDRWYVLSEGSDSIDVDQVADSPDNGGKCIRLDVETTGEKFGIAQIVEASNCTGLIGNTVTLSFAAKVSNARIDTVKAAVVAWSGTADTVTSDIISAWNADGTTPTLIANAAFENTPADLGVTTSWATYEITANVDTASTANLIVFIWSDDANNPLAGDFLYITNVQLEAGDTATPFEHRSYGQELALCQRYYFQADRYVASLTVGNAVTGITYPATMRQAPTISGGGSGFTTVVPNSSGVYFYQTATNNQLLIFDAEL